VIRRFCLTAAIAVALCPPLWAEEAVGDEDLAGLPIVSLEIVRLEIFDTDQPTTASWPYRAANALHVVTREKVIRSMLLFEEGDRYSPARAAESARILRSLGFLNPVHITAEPVEGGVAVRVTTHDQWTLEVGGNFGLFGSRSEFGIALVEKSFLGWAKEVSLEWQNDHERTSWAYSYVDPNIFGTRWRGRITHTNTSDGYQNLVKAEYPFYSLMTSRTWGGLWHQLQADDHLYSASQTRVMGEHYHMALRAWGGLRLPGNGRVTRRLVGAWDSREDTFKDWRWVADGSPYPDPEDRTISGPRLEYEQITDNFLVLNGFRTWFAQEDVALGPNFRAGLTTSLPAFGGDVRRFLLDAQFAMGRRSGRWLYLGNAWTSGRFDPGGPANWRIGAQVSAAQVGTRGWQMRLMAETTHRADGEVQLTLGADKGLRGWDPDYFDGTGRAVANLQWRMLLKDDVLNLFALGLVFFGDTGMTWGARVGPGTGRIRADIGIGLLADLTTIGLANELRIDLAVPDDGSGFVISVSSSALF